VGAGVAPRLPATVFALGCVSFFTDLASEMIVPLLPALYEAIGASMLQLGLLIGISDLVVALLKLVSGTLSDRLRRRKPWLVVGYGLSSLARPLFALVQTPWHAIAVRTGDRIGKGLRSAPRDALIADVVEPSQRGHAFGLQRALDHAGAFAGGLAGFTLLWFEVELRTVFALAIAPGLVAVLLVCFAVRERPGEDDTSPRTAEPEAAAPVAAHAQGPRRADPQGSLRRLTPFLGVVAMAAVAASIDLFALVRARELGVRVMHLPLLWILLHTTRSLLASWSGRLSDRVGRRRMLASGLLAHALVLTGFAFAGDALWMWPLFALLGLHAALTEGAERGYIADLTGAGKRGTGFGIYHAVQGVAAFLGPVTIGAVWDAEGSAMGFGLAAGASVMALVLLGLAKAPVP